MNYRVQTHVSMNYRVQTHVSMNYRVQTYLLVTPVILIKFHLSIHTPNCFKDK